MELHLGAISDSISKQLKKQNLSFDKDQVEHFEKDNDAICRLRIRSLINESATKSARDKLFKKVVAHVKSQNKAY